MVSVSIPLEQGNVLRHLCNGSDESYESQSLWNRAMSYDVKRNGQCVMGRGVSIPLEQGNVLRL